MSATRYCWLEIGLLLNINEIQYQYRHERQLSTFLVSDWQVSKHVLQCLNSQVNLIVRIERKHFISQKILQKELKETGNSLQPTFQITIDYIYFFSVFFFFLIVKLLKFVILSQLQLLNPIWQLTRLRGRVPDFMGQLGILK